MEFDFFRDAHAILFPERAPYFIAIAIGILAILPWIIFGRQAAMAFACTLATYYLTYEWLRQWKQSEPTLGHGVEGGKALEPHD